MERSTLEIINFLLVKDKNNKRKKDEKINFSGFIYNLSTCKEPS